MEDHGYNGLTIGQSVIGVSICASYGLDGVTAHGELCLI